MKVYWCLKSFPCLLQNEALCIKAFMNMVSETTSKSFGAVSFLNFLECLYFFDPHISPWFVLLPTSGSVGKSSMMFQPCSYRNKSYHYLEALVKESDFQKSLLLNSSEFKWKSSLNVKILHVNFSLFVTWKSIWTLKWTTHFRLKRC